MQTNVLGGGGLCHQGWLRAGIPLEPDVETLPATATAFAGGTTGRTEKQYPPTK